MNAVKTHQGGFIKNWKNWLIFFSLSFAFLSFALMKTSMPIVGGEKERQAFFEDAGKKIDKKIKNIGDKIDKRMNKVGDKIKESFHHAGERVKDATQ